MKKIKLSCGYEGKIDERVTNDFDILWKLRKVDKDLNCLFEVLNKLFGSDEEIDKLVECLKDEDGYVDNEKLTDAILETFNALGDAGKN